MAASVLPFHWSTTASPGTPEPQGWSNQERADIWRVAEKLTAHGVAVEIALGVSEDGDPWCCFVDPDSGDAVAHIARIDGAVVAVHVPRDEVVRGEDLRAISDRLLLRYFVPANQNTPHPVEVLGHPIAVLAAFVMTALELSRNRSADPVPIVGLQALFTDPTLDGSDPLRTDPVAALMAAALAEESRDGGDGAQEQAVTLTAARPAGPEPVEDDDTPAEIGRDGPARAPGDAADSDLVPTEMALVAAVVTEPGFTVTGSAGDDTLIGGDGNDTLHAGAGDDVVLAGAGDDIVYGGDGNDTLDGGAGNDSLVGEAGDDSLIGGDGNDTLIGGDGNDTAVGGDGDDSLVGEAGDDSLIGGAGNDTIDGGAGNDMLLDGGEGDDSIIGGAGADTLIGGPGNDTLFGGAGGDMLDGGEGDDMLLVDLADSIDGGDGDDLLFGEDGADSLNGGAGDDAIFGGLGPDLIDGGSGNDVPLSGGPGPDTVLGGEGNDLLEGDDGDDLLDAGAGNDTLLGGTGDDTVIGGEGDDVLLGGSGDDSLFGGEGNDTLISVAGNDALFGGPGNDLLINFNPNGQVFLSGDDGNDHLVNQNGDATIVGGAGIDVFEVTFETGHVVIESFELGIDWLILSDSLLAEETAHTDYNEDGDLVLWFNGDASITFTGLTALPDQIL